jgi:putative DNA primase/helicase
MRLKQWLGIATVERPHLTDLGNAQRFVARHGNDVRYCFAWRTWLVWDGTRWRRDPGDGAMRLMKATARMIYTEAATGKDPDERKAIGSWATRSESEPGLRRSLELAKSEPGIPVTPEQLDRDPWLLNCPNGTLELRTGHLRAHHREDLLTKVTAAEYVPGARHPVFEAYLARVLPDPELRRFIQRWAGYCLTGDVSEEKICFAHGPTAGGKSTLLKGLRRALGDYGCVADFSTFTERSRETGPREDVARLAGVRLVVSVEVQDGTRLAEGLLKWLSGGDDIAARRLYEATFEFAPQFKLLLAANHRPRVSDDDEAFWRRILEIPFRESIPEEERDPAVKAILTSPEKAGTAILAWAAEGAIAWFAEGLGVPPAVKTATREYREQMDPIQDFIRDACVLDPEAWVSSRELRDAYEGWCRENGIRNPLGGRKFGERLKQLGCARKGRDHNTQRGWQGVRLRGPDDEEEVERVGGGRVADGAVSSGNPLYTRAHKESSELDAPRRPPVPLAGIAEAAEAQSGTTEGPNVGPAIDPPSPAEVDPLLSPQELLDKIFEAGGRVIPDPVQPRLKVTPALKPLAEEHWEALRPLVHAHSLAVEILRRHGLEHLFKKPWARLRAAFEYSIREGFQLAADGSEAATPETRRRLLAEQAQLAAALGKEKAKEVLVDVTHAWRRETGKPPSPPRDPDAQSPGAEPDERETSR